MADAPVVRLGAAIPTTKIDTFRTINFDNPDYKVNYPLHGLPWVVGAGFQGEVRMPFWASDSRFISVVVGASGGFAGSMDYTTAPFGVTAGTVFHFPNGHFQASVDAGAGGWWASTSAGTTTKVGGLIAAGLAGKIAGPLNFFAKLEARTNGEYHQIMPVIGFELVTGRRPGPPVSTEGEVIDGHLAYQRALKKIAAIKAMGPGLKNRIITHQGTDSSDLAVGLRRYFEWICKVSEESADPLYDLGDSLATHLKDALVALDYAGSISGGVPFIYVSQAKIRVRELPAYFTQFGLELLMKDPQFPFLNTIEVAKIVEIFIEQGDGANALSAMAKYKEKLAELKALLSPELNRILSPVQLVDVKTLRRKIACLSEQKECASYEDAKHSLALPALQARLDALVRGKR